MVKGAITRENAAEYAKAGEDWLEGFNFGYRRDDENTWDVKNLPRHNRGGLYSKYASSLPSQGNAHSRSYSFAHAQFVWDAKSEPGIVGLFETIWGTDQLTVSFGESPIKPACDMSG